MAVFQKSQGKYTHYSYKNALRSRVLSYVSIILLTFIFFQVLSLFLLSSYRIGNESMTPTLSPGDKILASPLMYGPRIPFTQDRFSGFSSPKRGDMVICRPLYAEPEAVIYRIIDQTVKFFTLQKAAIYRKIPGANSGRVVVRRVLGIPGDTVKMENNTVLIKPEGKSYFLYESELIPEKYETLQRALPPLWPADAPFSDTSKEILLGEDEYFLIGDNRGDFLDSRYWGPLKKEDITAKVILRYWPFNEIDAL